MGRPPAYICVVRHGNRLDVTDKQWHLSSPTPYDPPLTYGGWQQSKALGAKIASVLRERELEDAAARGSKSPGARRKKYKIVIHSSPFLRCVQTSIAISAGLAANPSLLIPTPPPTTTPSPLASPLGPEPNHPPSLPGQRPKQHSVLRLDAFLGEWLTPTYYESITPPPSSVMMIASAKAELLRRENYLDLPHMNIRHHANSTGHGLSSSARSSPLSSLPLTNTLKEDHHGIEDLSSIGSSLPPSNYALNSSQSTQKSEEEKSHAWGNNGVYVAPTPSFAISPNGQIPAGYVAHAKDGCVNIDYQWDSMRHPYDWGDGGQYGEEWADMHKRFRSGMQHLVDWYAQAEEPTKMVTKTVKTHSRAPSAVSDIVIEEEEEEDIGIESVVILVSHGAGCNALIGAITQQPVLTDVAMASLTMAVRNSEDFSKKREPANSPSASWPTGHVAMDECYYMKLLANTDHLRSTPTSSRSPSQTIAGGSGGWRGRFNYNSPTPLSTVSFGDGVSRSSSMSAAMGPSRREPYLMRSDLPSLSGNGVGGITVGSGVTSFAHTDLSRRPSIGLWSPKTHEPDDDVDGMTLDFSLEETIHPSPVDIHSPAKEPKIASFDGTSRQLDSIHKTELKSDSSHTAEETEAVAELPRLGTGTGGLWGQPQAPEQTAWKPDTALSKRRWTVTERP